MKYVLLTGLACLGLWLGWRLLRRKLHGAPASEPDGPRTITLIAIGVAIGYSIWLSIRLFGG